MFTEALQAAVESILMIVLTIVIPTGAAYAAKKLSDWVKAKAKASESEYIINMFAHIGDTIESVVNHTTQTFVKDLKQDGTFNADMAAEALKTSRESALKMLNAESTALIETLHGDAKKWIETQIESIIVEQGLTKDLLTSGE